MESPTAVPGDDAATAIDKMRACLRLHNEEDLLDPLAALHDLDRDDREWMALSPVERGRRMQNAVCQLFETISASAPSAAAATLIASRERR